MRRSLSFTVVLLVLVSMLTGCTTAIVNEFRGEVRNLKHDGGILKVRDQIPGYCAGPSRAGGRYVGFSLPTPEISVFLFHPRLLTGQTLVTNTGSQQVEAWVMQAGDFEWSDFTRSGDPEQLRQHGGQRLEGRVAVRWESNADFNIVVNLCAGDADSTSLRGEFVGHTKTKFSPSVLWLGPAMLLFGAGGAADPTNSINGK